MLNRIKHLMKKVFFFKRNKVIYIEGENVTIKPDSSKSTDTFIPSNDSHIPRRKFTKVNWNGSKLFVQGYFFLEDIDLEEEDLVKKELIFCLKNQEKYVVTLKDIPSDQLDMEGSLDDRYRWAGFEGKIDLAKLSNNKPIESGEYILYLKLIVDEIGKGTIKKIFPTGNIENFFKDGFHSSKMEYFTAKRELKYNLLATYDYAHKSLKIVSSKLKDINPQEMGLADKESNDILYKVVKTRIFKLVYIICCMIPLKKHKVLFASDSRSDMSGNFYYIYKEMLNQGLDLDYHFILRGSVDNKKTISDIFSLAYHIATSQYIFLDDFYPMIYKLRIRKKAELIQLWHAVGAFKTFGFSRIGRPGGPSPRSKNHRNYTKVTVSSSNITKHYAEGFGISEDKVIPTGIPRTDVFFDEEYKEQVKKNLYRDFPFLKGKKVITFAPTFRGNGQQSAHYDLDALNLDELYHNLKDEYVFLFKMHPFVKNDLTIPYVYSEFFYDFSDYREINDLLFVTDILITDYSSVCFEFALLNKPMLFFAYDVEEYVQARDFYYDYLSFIPGPLVRNTNELIYTIENENYKMEKIPPFVNYFFEHADGKASERTVNHIFNEE